MAGKRFPHGHKALVREGFIYVASGKCREEKCGAALFWYRTPSGRRIPIDAEKLVPHMWICPAVERGKKRGTGEPAKQGDLFF